MTRPRPPDLAGDDALEAGEGAGLADKNPQPGGGVGDDGVERLDLLRGQAQALLFAAHIDRDDQRLAGIEQGARLRRRISENSVTSKVPLGSDICTKAKRLPRPEVRSLRPITMPASLKRLVGLAARPAGRSA